MPSFIHYYWTSFQNRFSGETASTLRFGQRVRFVRNEPVINEITEDDVNDLTDQIRLLKVNESI